MNPRIVNIVLSVVTFIIAAPLVVITLGRLVGLDSWTMLVLIETFAPIAFVPAYVWLAVTLGLKRWFLAGAMGVLVFSHVIWVGPEFIPAGPVSSETKAAANVTIYSHNMLFDNSRVQDISEVIKSRSADFVFLQELSNNNLDRLQTNGTFEKYPYRYALPTAGPSGIGMWSKHPLDNKSVIWTNDFPNLRAIAHVGNRDITLVNVHTHPPIGGGPVELWSEDLKIIKDRLHSDETDVVAAGDFNATLSHGPFRSIVSDGYSEAHAERGRGYARTWPAYGLCGKTFGGCMRIDHVLNRGDLIITHIEEDPANGSDHRALYARIALL